MSLSSARATVGALLMVIAMVFASACESKQPPSTPLNSSSSALPAPLFPNWPAEVNDFRFHWSAAPGIDVEAGPAVALRAYVESFRLAGLAGGDLSVLYPGFMRATPEDASPSMERGSLAQRQYVRPRSRAELARNGWKYVARQIYGYQPTHLLNLQPLGDGYLATVCLGLYSVYRTADDNHDKYFSTIADADSGQLRYQDGQTVEIWRVELRDRDPGVSNAPAAPTDRQNGPLPAPIEDVFGPWFITGNSSSVWGPLGEGEEIDTPEVRQQCENAMPDDAATRMAMATGFHDRPPPHGEPIPGWPAANK
jgi:hypothetical protein